MRLEGFGPKGAASRFAYCSYRENQCIQPGLVQMDRVCIHNHLQSWTDCLDSPILAFCIPDSCNEIVSSSLLLVIKLYPASQTIGVRQPQTSAQLKFDTRLRQKPTPHARKPIRDSLELDEQVGVSSLMFACMQATYSFPAELILLVLRDNTYTTYSTRRSVNIHADTPHRGVG